VNQYGQRGEQGDDNSTRPAGDAARGASPRGEPCLYRHHFTGASVEGTARSIYPGGVKDG